MCPGLFLRLRPGASATQVLVSDAECPEVKNMWRERDCFSLSELRQALYVSWILVSWVVCFM